ncbi:hypothetical protein L228DRAFT_280824 [Xylona heveae TC161]|uniref:Uncharacterized protein n=1 Tax=Xylona heveae (strain CBS 132557 / TC161) TaxID=1328760 RepID=A0A161TH85_XYLHT|nr:hypothetical protein L228DRAFT_280824 [Xylona heveae TC161]KZF25597.1 hypothetical protein L228DRAFT_280824 [Xylona heveae TC161]
MASSSKLKPPGDHKQSSRLPPPSLFLAPPSQAASTNSLLLQPTNSATGQPGIPPLLRSRSTRDQQAASHQSDTSRPLEHFQSAPSHSQQQASEQPPPLFSRSSGQAAMERADALWAEMQNTLEDVELSAASSTHVFGAEHSRAIEELGQKQIALAQAWAHGERDGEQELEQEKATLAADGGDARTGRAQTTKPESTTKHSELELGTDDDIVLARRRREANDRYFHSVKAGVQDVVAKLEDVAVAMRGVEQASKELWEDNDSVTGSLAS